MCTKKKMLLTGVLLVMAIGHLAQAAMLGVQLRFPMAVYDNQGTLNYDAGSDLLSIDATPLAMRFPSPGIFDTVSPRSLTIRVTVDGTGMLTGGVPGDDLVLVGDVDVVPTDGIMDYAGVLLTGEVVQFGYQDSGGPTDLYDFRFMVTGGALADLFSGQDIGVTVQSETSDFADDFAVSFSGEAKGTLGAIDMICALDLVVEGCVLVPPPPPHDGDCEGKLTSMTLLYTGAGPDAASHSQDPRKVDVIGDAASEEPVTILITDKRGRRIWATATDVMIGDEILVEAANAGRKRRRRYLGSETRVIIKNAAGDTIEEVRFHTSCSQPLFLGDQFGSLMVTSMTSKKGGEVIYDPLDDPEEPVCTKELPLISPPHCQGKVRVLSLRYTGGGCAASDHTQDPGKVECLGDADDATPVRIIAADSSGGITYLDQAGVILGDVVDIVALAGGRNELRSETIIQILDVGDVVIEEVLFHTSCSQPLNLGDKFGSLEVFALDTTEGTVAEEYLVEYTYTVTNNSDFVTLADVTVFDSEFGLVPGSPIASLGPGETVVLTLAVLLSRETTNTVEAAGYAGANICTAVDTETITMAQPPVSPNECDTKIQALLLEYIGPDITGANVTIIADKFDTPVVYTGVDLITGVTVLSSPGENGFTIDALAHDKTELGAKTSISINDVEEVIHTSCSTPVVRGAPAPLNRPKGDPSPTWRVVEFTQK